MTPRRVPIWLSLAGVVLLAALMGWAQEFRATVTGRVTDATGAGIPGAKVSVTNVGTNETSAATADAEGNYTVGFLIPGSYSIAVEAAGFKRVTQSGIVLQVGDKRTVNLIMEVGQVTESVTVTEEAPLLDEATASRGAVVDQLRVVELPLNGRNPINLANLTPGVVFAGNPQFTRPFDNGDNVNFSINGGLRQTNEYLIDGSPDDAVTNSDSARTRSQQNIAYIPTVDSTQEFRIQTNFYDAQYGRTGGGIVNITTKSGTNAFHGTGYDFLRRYQWDANTIQNNAAGRPRYGVDPVTHQNLGGHKLDQYGMELDGPVRIPKIYNGKDKTFFMFGVENYVESTPSPILTTVPTLAMRSGDFSAVPNQIYNPFSTRVNPNYNAANPTSATNAPYIRDPFPGNIIPANLFSTVGLNILKAYPAPNVGGPNQIVNNFIASPNLSQDHFRNWIGRVDQSFGEKERMFFRYAHNRRNQFDNGANGFTGIGRDAQDPLIRVNDTAVVDSLTVLSPSLLLDLRASFTRYAETALRQEVSGFDATTIGLPASYNAERFAALPPRISVTNLPDFGTRGERQDLTNTLAFEPSISWILGKQSIKAGIDLRDIRSNVYGGSFVYGGGQFSFNQAYTQFSPNVNDNSGSAIASLLLGVPASGIIQYTPALAYRWGYYAFYAQDDIRLTPKLTLNLGLRYDIEGSPSERYNRMTRGFAFNTPSPLAGAVRNADPANCPACANLTGGLLYAGQNGASRGAFANDLNNWQPRVGAAYAIAKNTVIRGGFGIFYLPEAAYGGSYGFAIDTAFTNGLGATGVNSYIPQISLNNPFPNGTLTPIGSSQGLLTNVGNIGTAVTVQNPNRKIPYVYQYSFGVERQLPGNIKLEASYVGSRTYDINTNDYQAGGARNINALPVSALQAAQQDPRYLTTAVTNPFYGIAPANTTLGSNATISRGQLLRPYPQFGDILLGSESVGRLWYDALQVNFEKRFSQGLVFEAAYTFSKNLEAISFLNSQDARPVKELAGSDRPQRLVISGVYQLPFGRGRLIGKDINRYANLIIGGWEYNVIGTIQSGTPLSYPGNAVLIGNPAISNQSFNQWFNTCVQQSNGTALMPDPAHKGVNTPCTNPAWQAQQPNTLRTIPFYSAQIRNPWAPQWDMSLSKRFYVTERISAQFRAEAFNVLNTPILGSPNTSITSGQFGFVAPNQGNFPRQIQLGIKANF